VSTTVDPGAVAWNLPELQRAGRPLLIVMHGQRGDEHDATTFFSVLSAELVLASVRAPIAESPGWSWFDVVANERANPTIENADRAADAVLTWLDALPFDPPLVGAMGFSQGGAMATHLLRRDPNRLAFAVNLAGFIVQGREAGDADLAVHRPHVLWSRGANDALFTSELIGRTEPWLATHTTLTTRLYPGLGHDVSKEMVEDAAAFVRERLV
jgi:phospholipase/carboxylesterase